MISTPILYVRCDGVRPEGDDQCTESANVQLEDWDAMELWHRLSALAAQGWSISPGRRALCPKCAKKFSCK